VTLYNATDEVKPAIGSKTGTYEYTHADDGSYEVLTEGTYSSGGDKYVYRDDGSCTDCGHNYTMGNVSVQAGDNVTLTITGFLVPDSGADTEPFAIGYYDTDFVWPAGWEFSATTETTLTLDLKAAGFNGGDLYIYIRDTDDTKNPNPDADTDSTHTSIKIDHLYVEVRHKSGQTSRLDHVWDFGSPAGGGDAYKFYVEAYRPTNAEGDNFQFQYSQYEDGPWSDLVMVSKSVDDDKLQSATMPTSVGGKQIYVRVIDTDGTLNNLQNDTLYVDYLRIDRLIVNPDSTNISVGSAATDVAVGDIDEDDVNDIVVGLVDVPYVRVYYGADWTSSDALTATDSVNSVDIGYFDGDDYLDVAAGTIDNKVLIWINGQSRASWTRSTLATTAGAVLAVRAGDIDGDYWDDIVYGTDSDELVFLRHVKGEYWESHDVKLDPEITAPFHDIDVGDASRGITLDPVREE